MTYTATYSPEDNKLRLYSSTRLDREIYAGVRGAGFIYAPKQELFVAPMRVFVANLAAQFDEEVFAFGCPHRRNEKLLFRRIDETCAPHAGVQLAV